MDLKEDYDIRLDIEEAKEVEVELEVTSQKTGKHQYNINGN